MLNSYKELKVWQKSIDLVVEICRLTNLFPKSELYGLGNQMRRASVSISSNIAERYTRKHRKEYAQFVRTEFSFGAELETQIVIARKLQLAPLSEFKSSEELLTEVMKVSHKLHNTLVAKLKLLVS